MLLYALGGGADKGSRLLCSSLTWRVGEPQGPGDRKEWRDERQLMKGRRGGGGGGFFCIALPYHCDLATEYFPPQVKSVRCPDQAQSKAGGFPKGYD